MEHTLDNFIFNAAIGANRPLSLGTDNVRFFPKEIAPFLGLRNFNTATWQELATTLPKKATAVLITAEDPEVPRDWQVVHKGNLFQLTASPKASPKGAPPIFPLGARHIPQMLALTKLTNPGPFAERTIEFGNYMGIFQGETLVSMAGHRFNAGGFVEVSAVCTHPDHLGKGYSGALVSFLAKQLLDKSITPFLHVLPDNAGAIRVYEKAGFVKRRDMHLNVIRQPQEIIK